MSRGAGAPAGPGSCRWPCGCCPGFPVHTWPLPTRPPTAPCTHAARRNSHLRDLLMDEERTDNLIREHNGVYADFSRQNVTETTIQVRAAWQRAVERCGALRALGLRTGMYVLLVSVGPRSAFCRGVWAAAAAAAAPAQTHPPAALRSPPIHPSTPAHPPPLPPPVFQLLLNLAERAKLRTKMNAMFAGEHINNTEDRAVLHTALRAPRDEGERPQAAGATRAWPGGTQRWRRRAAASPYPWQAHTLTRLRPLPPPHTPHRLCMWTARTWCLVCGRCWTRSATFRVSQSCLV